MKDPKAVLKTMEPWFEKIGSASHPIERTDAQRSWDAAVLACSEFVRRLTDYDEELAGAIHLLLTSAAQ